MNLVDVLEDHVTGKSSYYEEWYIEFLGYLLDAPEN
jgi:hypothetical protein